MIAEAEARNPGPWADHSRSAAVCASAIAAKCPDMDESRAYILGLLHDIGRREGVTSMRHIFDGYRYLRKMGFDGAADVCLTHSFMLPQVDTYFGAHDVEAEDIAFLTNFLNAHTMTKEDMLIQLCDAIAMPQGAVLMEKRLIDVAMRYGVYSFSVDKWKASFALKEHFDRATGVNIYTLFEDIAKNSL